MLRLMLSVLLVVSLSAVAPSSAADSSAATEAASVPAEGWQAGKHFTVIKSAPNPVAGKPVRVQEWFWYGCPHCFALEPYIDKWLKDKPAYIEFSKRHVVWRSSMQIAHARLFEVVEAMNLPPEKRTQLHAKILAATQADAKQADPKQKNNGQLFAKDDPQKTMQIQRAFVEANGVNGAEFERVYNSATIDQAMERTKELATSMAITGVPTMVIAGKYSFGAGDAGSQANVTALASALAACVYDPNTCKQNRIDLSQQ